MKLIYTTLNTVEEARKISRELLQVNLANCTNFWPINCIYNCKNKISEEAEVVLIIKTTEGKFEEIEKVIKSNITYENFIGELSTTNLNSEFSKWLGEVVK